MINIKSVDEILFGEDIRLKENKFRSSILIGLQNYFSKENTGLIPGYELKNAYKRTEIYPETKFGIDHMIAINEDKELIAKLNKSIFTFPNYFFDINYPLRLEKEKDVFGVLNSTKNELNSVKDFGNSYIIGSSFHNNDYFQGLTIVNKKELKKYLVRNPIKNKL